MPLTQRALQNYTMAVKNTPCIVLNDRSGPRGGVPRMQKLRGPLLVGAKHNQRFPLSKPVVGRYIALHAVPAYRASTYL